MTINNGLTIMNSLYSKKTKDGILIIRFLRSPTAEEFCCAIDDVSHDLNNNYRLWDMSCGVSWPFEQVRQVAQYGKTELTTPLSKIAFVAPHDLTFGLFRIHEGFRVNHMAEVHVFRDQDSAWKWLAEEQTKHDDFLLDFRHKADDRHRCSISD